ncbi:MAG: hypothetical protein R3260_07185, partial [Pseudomonas sp.]|nr:hypothetical protein [Pseudomonas sp.]
MPHTGRPLLKTHNRATSAFVTGSDMSSVSGKKLLIIAIACGVLAALLGWAYLKAKESQYKAAYRPVNQVKVSVVV